MGPPDGWVRLMCGACGAASAGSAAMHWSTPFLGSVPARTAAARNLTGWARRAGSSLTATGVTSGFQVATASGGRRLVGDLPAVIEQLERHGLGRQALLAGSVAERVIEGPPTRPAPRQVRSLARAGRSTDRSLRPKGLTLPVDPRRGYRLPGLLAWLALADGTGLLGTLRLELDLGNGTGLELLVDDGEVVAGQVRRTTGPDRLLTTTGSPPPQLVQLLG